MKEKGREMWRKEGRGEEEEGEEKKVIRDAKETMVRKEIKGQTNGENYTGRQIKMGMEGARKKRRRGQGGWEASEEGGTSRKK